MESLKFNFGGADKGKSGKMRTVEGLLLGVEGPDDGLHPMIEDDRRTADRLAADALKRAANDEALYVPSEEIERMLHNPGLSAERRDPPARDIVMSPDLFNPNQYGAGVALDVRGLNATPVSQGGLKEDLHIAPDTLGQALNNPGGFDLSPVEGGILAEKYRTPRAGADGRVRGQAPATPTSAEGLVELRTPRTAAERRKETDDEWRQAQAIVRMQQAGDGLAAFHGVPADSRGLEDARTADRRAAETGRNPEGLAAFQIDPRDKRRNSLVESDVVAGLRAKDPEKANRYADMKRKYIGLQTDIIDLEQKMAAQKDEVFRKIQAKVLAQFKDDLAALEESLAEMERSF